MLVGFKYGVRPSTMVNGVISVRLTKFIECKSFLNAATGKEPGSNEKNFKMSETSYQHLSHLTSYNQSIQLSTS